MPTLSAVVAGMSEQSGAFTLEAPESWAQGRTLYGGMTAALCLASAETAIEGLPPLRSAQFTFVGPASGHLAFTPSILRRGKSATSVAVDCRSEGGFVARALLVFGEGRTSEVRHDALTPPKTPPPDRCEPFFHEDAFRPGFSRNFEIKLAAGSRPMTGSNAPQFAAWVRHLDESGVDPMVALLALADALPPAAMVQFSKPAPISTVTWSIDFLHPVSTGGWRLMTSTSEQAADGYSLQAMDLWDETGLRLAAGRQLVAIFL